MAFPGAVVRVPISISNQGTGAPADPTGLEVIVHQPDSTQTTYVYGVDDRVVRASAGVYSIDVETPSSNSSASVGRWFVRWHGTGENAGAGEAWFDVERSHVTL